MYTLVTSEGNRSFLSLSSYSASYFDEAGLGIATLRALNEFESDHPELEIIRWNPFIKIERTAFNNFLAKCVIWIDHKQKKGVLPIKPINEADRALLDEMADMAEYKTR